MDLNTVCRTCFSPEDLNPIFLIPSESTRYSTAIFIATGLKVDKDDGLPQNMCTGCILQLNNCISFRKKAKETEIKLLQTKNELELEIEDSIKTSNTSDFEVTYETCKKYEYTVITDEKVEYVVNEINIALDKKEPIQCVLQENFEINDNQVKGGVINNEFDGVSTSIYVVNNKSSKDDDQNITDKDKDENKSKKYKRKFKDSKNKETINGKRKKKNKPPIQNDLDKANNETKDNNSAEDNNIQFEDSNDDFNTLYNQYFVLSNEDDENAKSKKVVCKLCQKVVAFNSMDGHMARIHPGVDRRKEKCEFCAMDVLKNRMIVHQNLKHGNGAYKCAFCTTDVENKEALIEHITTCTAKKKRRKPYTAGRNLTECDVCHKVMQKASLRVHKRVRHAGLGPVCEHCGRGFSNTLRLTEHYRARHGHEQYKCSYCEFSTPRVVTLQNHERRHRGEKPFACARCGARFHAAYLLLQHRQSHRDNGHLKCDQCPATFKANNSLHMHKASCHSTTSHRCMICDRGFRSRPYAVKHMRSVHGLKGDIAVHTEPIGEIKDL